MIQIEWNLLEKENLYIYDTVIIFNYKIKPDTTFSCSFKAKISVIDPVLISLLVKYTKYLKH